GTISMLRLADPDDAARYAGDLQGRYPQIGTALDWQDTRDDVLVTNRLFGLFLAAFGAILLFAGGLVVASTVTAQMFAKYREIGLLKAIGFTPGSLMAFTLFEHLAIGLVGSVLGWLAGAALAPSLQLRIAEVLDAGSTGLSLRSLVVTAVIVLAIIAASTALPAWRAGRVPTSEAISRGSAPRSARTSIVARLAGRLGLGPVGVTGIKNAFARPFRTTFSIATLTLSVLAGVIAIGMNTTIDAATTDPARTGDPWDVIASPQDMDGGELEAILDTTPEVASWYSVAERRVVDDSGEITARALAGDLGSSSFKIGDGRMLTGPDEAVVGYALLERLGVEVGDQTTVTLSGQPITFTVVGWFATLEDSGEILLFHLDDLQAIEEDAQPWGWFAEAGNDTSIEELRSAIGDATSDRVALRIREPFDDLDAFQVAFAIITVLVLAVGLANLVASTVQMMQERTRDVAVLKALGFTPVQVVASVVLGAAAIAIAAVAIGGLLAIPLYAGLMNTIGVELGVGPGFGVSPGTATVVTLLVFIIAATAALAGLAAQRPARSSVADVLRAE
ncbi:MAG: FtsX-like permease family protein, partial [Acidimicrobiia bacterium]|nr:FtsX-like permease family protein [Acidimicrobiia bacterium]